MLLWAAWSCLGKQNWICKAHYDPYERWGLGAARQRQRLNKLKMISQQRRLERYRMIYVWKILEGLAPDPGLAGCVTGDRRGRECLIPRIKSTASEKIKTLREASFQVHGPKLFNMLPKNIRGMTKCGIADFKEQLDSFLSTIPDQPKIGHLVPATCSLTTNQPSNSPVDQIRKHWPGGRGRTLGWAILAVSLQYHLRWGCDSVWFTLWWQKY